MKIRLEDFLWILRAQAIWGSLHGFHRIFTGTSHRLKLLWAGIMTVFVSIWFYFLTVLYHEHFVNRPVVTSMRYIRQKELTFPDILVCPQMTYQSITEKDIPPSLVKILSFLLFAGINPLFVGFRNELVQNLTLAFHKYPAMETNWEKLYTDNSITQALGLFKLFGVSFSQIATPFCRVFAVNGRHNQSIPDLDWNKR